MKFCGVMNSDFITMGLLILMTLIIGHSKIYIGFGRLSFEKDFVQMISVDYLIELYFYEGTNLDFHQHTLPEHLDHGIKTHKV